ncbi:MULTISPECIES: hypothetical protein [Paraburkholderia]|uniref:hypothetical protein n=1 Tax=Paraburkholderia TaxID=1822464 RepID=UPI0013A6C81F|nr:MULTISPECIES: hypothetical protein [Paraburkholderia]MDH6147430.1 hypothetical protein [Paraburkholderia sp. WSM4179]
MNEIPGAPRRFASHGASDRFATTQGRALRVVLYRFPTAFQWVTIPPHYPRSRVTALKEALLHSRIAIDDSRTVSLLTPLQTLHDVFGVWDWERRLKSIAIEFDLSDRVLTIAA